MKKYIFKGLFIGSFSLLVTSCNFLDIKPLDSYTETDVFSDLTLTDAYVTRNYNLLRTGFSSNAMRFVCDESHNNFNWASAYVLTRGQMTPDQSGTFGTWKDYYTYIRACNIFFNNIDNLKADEAVKNMLIGEMTFFRAYYYMDLVNRYGGVPLITRTFELEDAEMFIARNTYEECVDFIVKEFDKAASLLPLKHTGAKFGRATKGAALTFKSRMLLYAASSLWNLTNDKAKWQKAADAAKAVLDLNAYSLDPDYKGLFINSKSPEIILERLYTTEFSNGFDWQNSPNGWTGWSATCVVQDMVDSYEMEDGTMPDPAKYATAKSNPWEGRDPRFYASIVCDGQMFRDREAQFWVNEDGKTGGLDSEFGIDNWNASKTHYTIRKFMDESLTKPWIDKGAQPWIFARYAEIYLNYAEALYNLGKEDEARANLNIIRDRARGGKDGVLPDITASGEALLAKIQHERKIELAFEDHRFFDVRRWKIAEVTDNIDAKGIKIVKKANGDKSYQIVTVDTRKFTAPNHYLFPIPRTEIQKASTLTQNPGYN